MILVSDPVPIGLWIFDFSRIGIRFRGTGLGTGGGLTIVTETRALDFNNSKESTSPENQLLQGEQSLAQLKLLLSITSDVRGHIVSSQGHNLWVLRRETSN